jgi:nitrite reductase/ring-hydroxylating ferredoxin subunit/uncharacterized membrane protein
MKPLSLVRAIDRIENASALDPIVKKLRGAVETVVRPQWLRDVLHGVPFGHAIHPLLVQVPLGAWLSAAVLDCMPGRDRAARTLVGAGVLSAAPAAVAGYTDWSRLHPQQMRVGVVHSASNLIATALFAGSYLQRVRGRSGKALSFAGLVVVSAGGFLGGHMSYRQAAGANHAEDVPHRVGAGWHPLVPLSEVPEGTLVQHTLGETPLLLFRRGEQVAVLSDVCSHLSGPLHEGTLELDEAGGPCVVCPWHQSTFSLETGEPVHGPATSPQPKFESRVVGGMLEICLPGAD